MFNIHKLPIQTTFHTQISVRNLFDQIKSSIHEKNYRNSLESKKDQNLDGKMNFYKIIDVVTIIKTRAVITKNFYRNDNSCW